MMMITIIALNDHDNCRLPLRTQHAPLPKPALVADVLNRWKSLLSSLKKVFKRVSFFNECFQTSGLCLTKVFKYVVFVWKKFSIFFKNIFFPQGCDCDPTAENPDRFCFHKMVFDFMQLMAIPWQLLIIQWQYHGNYHLLKMTLVKGVASLLLNWNHALSLQMYCQSWAHIFTKICLSF